MEEMTPPTDDREKKSYSVKLLTAEGKMEKAVVEACDAEEAGYVAEGCSDDVALNAEEVDG